MTVIAPPVSEGSFASMGLGDLSEDSPLNISEEHQLRLVGEIDVNVLLADLERSHAARLRAWSVLGELRAILTAAGLELEKPARKSFVEEGRIQEQGLRKALTERDEALRDLAAAARWVDDQHLEKRRVLGRLTGRC